MESSSTNNAFKESSFPWLKPVLIILCIDWIIGIIFVQYFYHYMRKLRFLDPEIKRKAYPFINSVEKWDRVAHSLGSVFMLPRVLLLIIVFASLPWLVRILLIGIDVDKPVTGWRKKVVQVLGKISGRLSLFCVSFIWITYRTDNNIDYTPWLGSDWRSHMGENTVVPPIMTANHRACTVLCVCVCVFSPPFSISNP